MKIRMFALIFGLVYLLIGILGFFPALRTGNVPTVVVAPSFLAVDQAYGLLFGLFLINTIHNLVHVAIGMWGVIAFRNFADARLFARGAAIVFLILTIFGLIPGLNTLFGLVPLYGHSIWLHALSGIVAAVFGWMPASEAYGRSQTGTYPR